MDDSLAAIAADIDDALDAAAHDAARGWPPDTDALLRALRYVRERLAGPRIAVTEHSLPGDVPADLWHRAVAAALGATGGAGYERAMRAWRGGV